MMPVRPPGGPLIAPGPATAGGPGWRVASRRARILAAMTALLAAFAPPATLAAQTIVGYVLDDVTEAPVATAAIMLLDSTDTAVRWAESDSVGRFFITAPGAGTYRLYADRLAYGEIVSETFPLGDAGSVELLVRMVPLPIELDAMVVTAERRRLKLEEKGFYRRERASMGYFFDTDEIQLRHPLRATDVMREVPGVYLRRQRLGGLVALTWRLGSLCPMKVVVDGFKLDTSSIPLDDLINPDLIIGMEVYPGGVGAPVQHRGVDSRCGVVMIWTR